MVLTVVGLEPTCTGGICSDEFVGQNLFYARRKVLRCFRFFSMDSFTFT